MEKKQNLKKNSSLKNANTFNDEINRKVTKIIKETSNTKEKNIKDSFILDKKKTIEKIKTKIFGKTSKSHFEFFIEKKKKNDKNFEVAENVKNYIEELLLPNNFENLNLNLNKNNKKISRKFNKFNTKKEIQKIDKKKILLNSSQIKSDKKFETEINYNINNGNFLISSEKKIERNLNLSSFSSELDESNYFDSQRIKNDKNFLEKNAKIKIKNNSIDPMESNLSKKFEKPKQIKINKNDKKSSLIIPNVDPKEYLNDILILNENKQKNFFKDNLESIKNLEKNKKNNSSQDNKNYFVGLKGLNFLRKKIDNKKIETVYNQLNLNNEKDKDKKISEINSDFLDQEILDMHMLLSKEKINPFLTKNKKKGKNNLIEEINKNNLKEIKEKIEIENNLKALVNNLNNNVNEKEEEDISNQYLESNRNFLIKSNSKKNIKDNKNNRNDNNNIILNKLQNIKSNNEKKEDQNINQNNLIKSPDVKNWKNFNQKKHKKEENLDINNNIENNINNNINEIFNSSFNNKNEIKENQENELNISDETRSIKNFNNIYDTECDEEWKVTERSKKRVVISIDSYFKEYIDYISTIFIFYTIIISPYQFAFAKEDDLIELNFLIILDFTIDFFFMFDFIINFFVTYRNEKDEEIFSLIKIAKNYAKTWMIFDLISCFPFTFINYYLTLQQFQTEANDNTLISNGTSKIQRIAKFAKIYRMLKWSKFIRFLKIAKKDNKAKKVLEDLNGLKSSIMNFLQFLIIFFLAVHFFACFWIFIANNLSENGDYNNWINYYKFFNQSNFDIYIASFYFILVTICSIGYGDLTPRNHDERFFSLFLLTIGSLIFSYALSSLATIFSQIETKKEIYNKREEIFKEIRKKYHINEKLNYKIKESLKHDLNSWNEDRLRLIDSLPSSLKNQLCLKMYQNKIKNLVFFDQMSYEFITVTIEHLRSVMLQKNEKVISIGELITEMFLIINGRIGVELGEKYDKYEICIIPNNFHFGDILMYTSQQSKLCYNVKSKHSEMFIINKVNFASIKLAFDKPITKLLLQSYEFFMKVERTRILASRYWEQYNNFTDFKGYLLNYIEKKNQKFMEKVDNNNLDVSYTDNDDEIISELEERDYSRSDIFTINTERYRKDKNFLIYPIEDKKKLNESNNIEKNISFDSKNSNNSINIISENNFGNFNLNENKNKKKVSFKDKGDIGDNHKKMLVDDYSEFNKEDRINKLARTKTFFKKSEGKIKLPNIIEERKEARIKTAKTVKDIVKHKKTIDYLDNYLNINSMILSNKEKYFINKNLDLINTSIGNFDDLENRIIKNISDVKKGEKLQKTFSNNLPQNNLANLTRRNNLIENNSYLKKENKRSDENKNSFKKFLLTKKNFSEDNRNIHFYINIKSTNEIDDCLSDEKIVKNNKSFNKENIPKNQNANSLFINKEKKKEKDVNVNDNIIKEKDVNVNDNIINDNDKYLGNSYHSSNIIYINNLNINYANKNLNKSDDNKENFKLEEIPNLIKNNNFNNSYNNNFYHSNYNNFINNNNNNENNKKEINENLISYNKNEKEIQFRKEISIEKNSIDSDSYFNSEDNDIQLLKKTKSQNLKKIKEKNFNKISDTEKYSYKNISPKQIIKTFKSLTEKKIYEEDEKNTSLKKLEKMQAVKSPSKKTKTIVVKKSKFIESRKKSILKTKKTSISDKKIDSIKNLTDKKVSDFSDDNISQPKNLGNIYNSNMTRKRKTFLEAPVIQNSKNDNNQDKFINKLGNLITYDAFLYKNKEVLQDCIKNFLDDINEESTYKRMIKRLNNIELLVTQYVLGKVHSRETFPNIKSPVKSPVKRTIPIKINTSPKIKLKSIKKKTPTIINSSPLRKYITIFKSE